MKIISLGLGVQSTALYLMSSLNKIERADYAIFADTGGEYKHTYQTLKDLKSWKNKNNGIEILVTKENNLLKDLLKGENQSGDRFPGIPGFTKQEDESISMVRRQCTSEYKIKPIIKTLRKLHGLKKYQRMKPTKMYLGISLDEIQRAKISSSYNIDYCYPLIDKRMTRKMCIDFFKKTTLETPKKSACVFCPFHSNRDWKRLKEGDHNGWDLAVKVDKAIRNSFIDRGKKGKMYLHNSGKPLNDVYLQEDQEELFMCEEGFCGL